MIVIKQLQNWSSIRGGIHVEIGLTSFVETTRLPSGETLSHAKRLQNLMEEIRLADEVGLDVFGVGEHHRADFACSAPAVTLAGAAMLTKNIRLSSAVSVISSDDPVRLFQEFATLDALSNGRAEIMAGRGSFIESFPLFGYDLNDYHALYEEKLELLLKLQQNEFVEWEGKFRPSFPKTGIYPRPVQKKLPIWIATGGTPESSYRAGLLGLPIVFAIIGGKPSFFKQHVKLYYDAAKEAGHDLSTLQVASHSHGFVARTDEEVVDKYYPSMEVMMNVLAKERGWSTYNRTTFDIALSPEGALFAGDVQSVANKIIALRKDLGVTRFMMHLPVGSIPHEHTLEAIRLLGTEVAPIVRREVKKWEAAQG